MLSLEQPSPPRGALAPPRGCLKDITHPNSRAGGCRALAPGGWTEDILCPDASKCQWHLLPAPGLCHCPTGTHSSHTSILPLSPPAVQLNGTRGHQAPSLHPQVMPTQRDISQVLRGRRHPHSCPVPGTAPPAPTPTWSRVTKPPVPPKPGAGLPSVPLHPGGSQGSPHIPGTACCPHTSRGLPRVPTHPGDCLVSPPHPGGCQVSPHPPGTALHRQERAREGTQGQAHSESSPCQPALLSEAVNIPTAVWNHFLPLRAQIPVRIAGASVSYLRPHPAVTQCQNSGNWESSSLSSKA